jgi:hypothetical protein
MMGKKHGKVRESGAKMRDDAKMRATKQAKGLESSAKLRGGGARK